MLRLAVAWLSSASELRLMVQGGNREEVRDLIGISEQWDNTGFT
jgi:hypothetical protein